MLVHNKEVVVGSHLYYVVDERPFYGCAVKPVTVTEVHNDHILCVLDDDTDIHLWFENDMDIYWTKDKAQKQL